MAFVLILLIAAKLHLKDRRAHEAKVCKMVPASMINFTLALTVPSTIINILASLEPDPIVTAASARKPPPAPCAPPLLHAHTCMPAHFLTRHFARRTPPLRRRLPSRPRSASTLSRRSCASCARSPWTCRCASRCARRSPTRPRPCRASPPACDGGAHALRHARAITCAAPQGRHGF
jgi:hypothetical protein